MATKAGAIDINLNLLTSNFQAGVKQTKQGLAGLRESINTADISLRGFATAFAGIAAGGFVAKQILDVGAAVEETASKFDTVFGPAALGVEESLQGVARLAGLSTERMQALAATSGQIASGMGFSQAAAADMAVEITKLAADLGSFNNIPVAETSMAIQAALTGEREQLKRLGIVLKQTEVDQRAMAISGAESTKELTNQARAAASLQLVTERAGVAIGDLDRTQDTAAAKARILAADLQNVRDSLATALMPALVGGLEKLNEFVLGMQLWIAEIKIGWESIKLLNERFKAWVNRTQEQTANIEAQEAAVNEATLALHELEQQIISQINGTETATETQKRYNEELETAALDFSAITENTALLNRGLVSVSEIGMPKATEGARLLAWQLKMAADEQERLNSFSSKFNQISGALGFLGGFFPMAAPLVTALGTISSGVGIGEGLINTFKPADAGLASLRISISGISDGTTRVIRGKLSDFDRRDIPVVI